MLSLNSIFKKETRYGNNNLYRIMLPSLVTDCVVQKYEDKVLTVSGLSLDAHKTVVALETQVSQELFPKCVFSDPYVDQLCVKIPTRYSHIIIPMIDTEHRRITSGQLVPGATLATLQVQPKTAWELDGYCGVRWNAVAICLKK